jgi:hypothetical protein
MKRYILIAAMLSVFATPSQAGLNEGIAAGAAGNYAQAAAEFEPLAAAGDPAAQYYLAKLYLEGHGPTSDVPRGVSLMTQAANSNYPEAQAQLGLMYAMGLGVTADNALAYDWLTKAVTALPDGTRRSVALANRDTVLQRMTPAQRNAVAGGTAIPAASAPVVAAAPEPAPTATPTPAPTPTAAPAPAPETAAEPAAPEPATTQAAAVEPEPAPAPQPETTQPAAAKTTEPAPAAPAASTETPAEAPAAPAVVDSEPEQSASVEVPADAEPAAEPAATAKPASADQVKTGVRIQMASLPSEDAAWAEWKRISKEQANQVSGLTAVVETADLGTKGIFYRLQAGPFDTIAAAKERCAKMKEAGLDCLVVGKE